ncbi:uncharacterized protein N7515_003430 [Penicillium bovifimosum]|uniref:Uncharacterized protein n=1 Tax=Penicillium bovifimosum TaxID=126998 RepID=A0A9W9L686_9EURO|nr:uncharacterized protein N7515_003430 [Penicillium bovifimosum]KAJ5138582.1 hypothetical protein N7515_003430 [Penicillium bovifimosum]
MLNILSEYMEYRGYKYQRLDGTIPSAARRDEEEPVHIVKLTLPRPNYHVLRLDMHHMETLSPPQNLLLRPVLFIALSQICHPSPFEIQHLAPEHR